MKVAHRGDDQLDQKGKKVNPSLNALINYKLVVFVLFHLSKVCFEKS